MIIKESGCVDCDLPCIYQTCPYYEITRYLCDECEAEDILYNFDGQELCAECILKRLPKINESDIW